MSRSRFRQKLAPGPILENGRTEVLLNGFHLRFAVISFRVEYSVRTHSQLYQSKATPATRASPRWSTWPINLPIKCLRMWAMKITYKTIVAAWILSGACAFGFHSLTQNPPTESLNRAVASTSGKHGFFASPVAVERCDHADYYHCEERSYGPDLADSTESTEVCLNDAPSATQGNRGSALCVSVVEIHFNAQIGTAHVTEAKCTNGALSVGKSMIIEAEASDAAAALQATRTKCLEMVGSDS